ncbi:MULTISPECIES: BatD family protein [unclassified Lentimicrobium]|uniref:BatD family protein n=1 Tax=unclassified Lentimicrobium TaxID=2677434 RepID=UPI0015535871|nr:MULTISPECIES: BatD family protein [unclassified Lentimicrobium]NPD44147.1 protein BatD [Lentimicrobium sp. S6]NPD83259.1 protein BatD [Lentimicrobium sp. L6]
MKRIIIFFILMLGLYGIQMQAAEVDFKVSAPAQVRLGERFRLTYQINADVDQFTPPALSGLQILSGPSRGQNSSIQIINGKVSQNINVSYTYILAATQEGKVEIPAAEIKVNGKSYQSTTKTINVVKAGQSPNQSTKTQSSSNENKGSLKADDVYIKAFSNKKSAYLGEQIIVSYRIYTKVPVSNLSIDKLSSFNGFWNVELLENNGKLNQRNEIINGEEYIVADLKRTALFPQKTGKLEIEPMSLSCVVQVQTSNKRTSSNDPFFDSFFNDPFFSNNYRNIEKTLFSNQLNLEIKDLPNANKPVNFTGAVGQYSLGSNIDHRELMANEAITLKYTISGQGNVDLLPDLNVSFPADFEVYDPKISTKTRKNKEGINGYKTYEYTVIPRSAGTYEIPTVEFSYFDPVKKQYKKLSSDSYEIKVNKSNNTNQQNVTYGGSSKEDIRYIGKDIRYIFLMPFELEPYEHFFFGSYSFYILLISPIIIMLFIIMVWQRERKRRGNTSLMKNKNATKVAKKRLKKSHEFLKAHQEADFYNEIGQALWGYVSDKFNIPLSELSSDTVNDKLLEKGVNENVIREFIDTLNNSEFARFAPGDKDSMMEKVYQQGLNIISKIEDQLK